MPKQHGIDVLKQAKQRLPSLPVIVVSGYHSVEIAQAALSHGAVDYIPKPFDSAHILHAVTKALSATAGLQ